MGRVSCSRPQASVRAGRPGAVGVSTWTEPAAWAMAAVSRPGVAQAGGDVAGPPGPSRRMTAWKWTTPRHWYSATLANETRTCLASAVFVIPAWRAGARVPVRAGPAASAGTAGQHPAAAFAASMDRAERGGGERSKDARVGGDGSRDAFAAGQPGADELVGVGAVDLGAGQAAGRPAGLAGDGQDAAGLVDGGVAVQEFAGGAIDVVDAAAQQDGLHAPARVTCLGPGIVGTVWDHQAASGESPAAGVPSSVVMAPA